MSRADAREIVAPRGELAASLDPNERLRRAIYRGGIYQLGATEASLRLAREVRARLARELGSSDVRRAPSAMSAEAFFHAVGRVRRDIFLSDSWAKLVTDVVVASGFDARAVAFDPVRLRVIAHLGHENPRAAPVYYPHRDTWYAHPQSIITWWIPFDDLAEDETFVFYPERFAEPVPNDSEVFDYDAWVSKGWSLKIGWQDLEAGRTARYPSVTGSFEPGRAVGFSCREGDNLLFSGAHFHRTLPQATGRCRYSLDFRLVHLGDEARGLGAPNVDNRSRGSALADYVRPAVGEPPLDHAACASDERA